MPFCPDCREEYDETRTECAECGAGLVASLEAGPAVPAEVKILVEDDQVGQALVNALLGEGLEVHLDAERHAWNDQEVPAVAVPGELYEFVAVFLTRSDRFQVAETDEQGRGVVGFFDPTALDAVRRHPLLRKKPRDIAAMGEAVIPELGVLLRGAEPEIRRWASRRLLDLAGPGVEALREAMFQAVGQGDRDLIFTVLRALEEATEAGIAVERSVPAGVRDALGAEDPSVRALGSLVLGRFGRPEDVPRLLPLLADPEPLVLEEVVEAIESLTGIPVDLHAGSSEAERQAVIANLLRRARD